MKKTTLLFLLCVISLRTFAQGNLSGDLMTNVNFFNRDPSINAANNPLYDNYLSGGEGWLSLRYNYNGFNAFLRIDGFQNSNLYQPTQAMTGFGIGAFSLSKEIKGLTITGGYIYDQIGSGILFRSYEDRGLLIDNALVGLHLKYQLNDHVLIKGFTGQQKNVQNFGRFEPVIKGLNVEGDFNIGKSAHIQPGIGLLNRTMDQNSMNSIVSTINNYPLADRFVPEYNTYAFTAYNTLIAGDFSWYVEGAYKTHEAIKSDIFTDVLHDKSGNVEYTTLGFAKKGFAINITGKRTENFVLRTSPNEVLIRGVLNWQPIVARIRPQRLLARYTPASQDVSEQALGTDILLNPNDKNDFTLSFTHINTLEQVKLYREIYAEWNNTASDKWRFQLGAQYLEYNQEIYQIKPGVPLVKAITGFGEATYRFNDKTSLRTEWEYMNTKQDYGSWLFGLLELNIAPKWSFSVSDMYTLDLNPNNLSGLTEPKNYYNIFAAYTKGPHRFTLAYVKQVDGINCTGGVCRYEPAFSGVKATITSSF